MAPTFITAVAEFVDYATIFVIILTIYFIIKLIIFQTKDEEREMKERSEKMVEYFKEKGKEKEEKKKKAAASVEQKKREDQLKAPRAHFVEVITDCGEFMSATGLAAGAKTPAKKKSAEGTLNSHLGNLKKHLRDGIRDLNQLRRKEKAGSLHQLLTELFNDASATLLIANALNVPDPANTTEWTSANFSDLANKIAQIRGGSANVLKHLDDYAASGV